MGGPFICNPKERDDALESYIGAPKPTERQSERNEASLERSPTPLPQQQGPCSSEAHLQQNYPRSHKPGSGSFVGRHGSTTSKLAPLETLYQPRGRHHSDIWWRYPVFDLVLLTGAWHPWCGRDDNRTRHQREYAPGGSMGLARLPCSIGLPLGSLRDYLCSAHSLVLPARRPGDNWACGIQHSNSPASNSIIREHRDGHSLGSV